MSTRIPPEQHTSTMWPLTSPTSDKAPVVEAEPASNTAQNAANAPPNADHNKAPRAAVACAACRARKIKCSGDHPVCVTCGRSGQECVYPPVKRRREPRKPFVRSTEDAESSSMGAKRRDLGQATIDREWKSLASTGVTPRATYQNNTVVGVQAPAASTGFTPSSSFAFLHDPSPGNGSFPGFVFDSNSPSWQSGAAFGPSPATINQFTTSHEIFPTAPVGFSPTDSNGNPSDSTAARPELWAKASASPSNPSAPHGMVDGQIKTKYRVPYFRFFGPTAIAPGYKKVVCDVTAPPSPTTEAQALLGQTSTSGGVTLDAAATEVYGDCPSTEVLQSLLPLFQLHFGYFFPSLRLTIDPSGRLSRDVPHCLLNIICALASRFSSQFGLSHRLGEPPAASAWATKAKTQISQSLGFATPDTVLTLLMISWYEFGQDRDGGLWMYSGMALRMGQDLGLDTYSGSFAAAADDAVAYQRHLDDQRLQCSLRMMDAIMAIGTGRPAMYQAPVTPVPTFPSLTVSAAMTVADPLPYTARIFALADDMTRILVSRDRSTVKAQLERAQSDLNDFHNSLPVELHFETSSFQVYTGVGQGSIFVLLHLWFHTLVILAYQPSLISSSEKVTDSSKEVAASSAKTILDIATFAELIDAKAIAQPWINYPMYTAACVFLSQCLHASPQLEVDTEANLSAGNIHMAKTAKANFQRIVTILDKLQSFWHGVRYIKSVLIQKSDGVDQLKLFEEENPGVMDLPPELAALWAEVAGGTRSDMVGLSLTGTMDLPFYADPGSG